MNGRDLDNWITGHYGEKQFNESPDLPGERYDVIHLTVNDAKLYWDEQKHIEEAYAEAQKIQDSCRHMNDINDFEDHGIPAPVKEDDRMLAPWPTDKDYNATPPEFKGLANN